MKKICMFAGIAGLSFLQAKAAAPKPAPKPPIVTASDPASVVAGLAAAGYTPVLAKDNSGDPTITFSDAGGGYRVWFQGCENHEHCKVLQFYCEWGVSLVTPQKLNDEWIAIFNTPATVYVNKTNQHLAASSYLMTDPGGVSRDLFIAYAKRWQGDTKLISEKFTTPSK